MLFFRLLGDGCVVEFVSETKLNTVRKESSALNVAEEKDHQIETGKKMIILFCNYLGPYG